MVTVTLAKNAKAQLRVRHGANVYTLAPGGTAEVPERIAQVMVRQGAKVKQGSGDDEGSDAATS